MYSTQGGEGSSPRPPSLPSPPISCPVYTTGMSATAACVPSPQPMHCGTLSRTAMLLAGGALLPQRAVCLGSLFAFCSQCHLLSTHFSSAGSRLPTCYPELPQGPSYSRVCPARAWSWTGSTGPAAGPCDPLPLPPRFNAPVCFGLQKLSSWGARGGNVNTEHPRTGLTCCCANIPW